MNDELVRLSLREALDAASGENDVSPLATWDIRASEFYGLSRAFELAGEETLRDYPHARYLSRAHEESARALRVARAASIQAPWLWFLKASPENCIGELRHHYELALPCLRRRSNALMNRLRSGDWRLCYQRRGRSDAEVISRADCQALAIAECLVIEPVLADVIGELYGHAFALDDGGRHFSGSGTFHPILIQAPLFQDPVFGCVAIWVVALNPPTSAGDFDVAISSAAPLVSDRTPAAANVGASERAACPRSDDGKTQGGERAKPVSNADLDALTTTLAASRTKGKVLKVWLAEGRALLEIDNKTVSKKRFLASMTPKLQSFDPSAGKSGAKPRNYS